MTYVKRNAKGDIVALLNEASEEGLEVLAWNHPEIIRFLEQSSEADETMAFLRQSDLDLVRVVEDLIELLVDKNVIMFTELPEEAQRKVSERNRLRQLRSGALDLLDDDTLF